MTTELAFSTCVNEQSNKLQKKIASHDKKFDTVSLSTVELFGHLFQMKTDRLGR